MITARLKDGLGNRLFQVAALLGYAERWDLKPVFFPGRIIDCAHEGSASIPDLFPHIPIVWDLSGPFITVDEAAADYCTYVERATAFGRDGSCSIKRTFSEYVVCAEGTYKIRLQQGIIR